MNNENKTVVVADDKAHGNQVGAWPKRIDLSKPVEAHGEQITQLVLHEPTGGDLMKLPFIVADGGDKAIEPPLVLLSSKMAKVPPSTIESLCSDDTFKVMKVVNPLAAQWMEALGG